MVKRLAAIMSVYDGIPLIAIPHYRLVGLGVFVGVFISSNFCI